jgi:hypothetical protein
VPVAGGRDFQKPAWRESGLILLIALVHLPLGLLLYRMPQIAILHPITVFLVGVYWAVQKRYPLDQVALIVAYLIGAEVLWRMAQVPIYWEFGKYGSVVIVILALAIRRRFKIPKLPMIYFLALIPACLITLMEFDPAEAQGHLSFNMSGPFFLAVSCWFFSHVRLTPLQVRRVLLAIIIPLLSVGAVTLFFSVATENIQFTTESNFATSGGFGPNQVSSMLGLGVFLAAGCVVLFRDTAKFKVILAAAAVFFAAQSILTFSRGGIYNAVGGLLVLILFHFRDLADGLRRLVPILAVVALFLWFVFPLLNSFTGGKLSERFEETETTHRIDIAESDWRIFQENPVFGVGVGIAYEYRRRFLEYSAASHTEFSRLISEHGSLGIIALLSLFSMTVLNLIRQRSTLGRALVAGVAVWSILFMFNAGMRLAAPSFIWGMSFITIVGVGRSSRSARLRELGPMTRWLSRVNAPLGEL